MSPHDGVTRLISRRGPLLLDFDGPICQVFAGYPAPAVAAELVETLRRRAGALPASLEKEHDPLEVLRWAGSNVGPDAVQAVEDALCTAELRAAASSEPTPFAREVIVAARQIGMSVAVVSNNSAGAVSAYLTRQRLLGHVSPIVGRAYAEPDRMKPSPEPVLRAVNTLHAAPSACVLVDDSLSGIESAKAAGAAVIGYANKPHKVDAFTAAGADVVITSMADLASALLALVDE
jgi:HAD superfamily hydrolase (TIGR01509 family)